MPAISDRHAIWHSDNGIRWILSLQAQGHEGGHRVTRGALGGEGSTSEDGGNVAVEHSGLD